MSIRFEPCPVHEPSDVEYEKPCVFNDETNRWACAVCGAEGEFRPPSIVTGYQTDFGVIDAGNRSHPLMNEGKPARIGKLESLVDPEKGKKVISAAVFEAGIEKLAEVLESAKANSDVVVTVKCFESEEK